MYEDHACTPCVYATLSLCVHCTEYCTLYFYRCPTCSRRFGCRPMLHRRKLLLSLLASKLQSRCRLTDARLTLGITPIATFTPTAAHSLLPAVLSTASIARCRPKILMKMHDPATSLITMTCCSSSEIALRQDGLLRKKPCGSSLEFQPKKLTFAADMIVDRLRAVHLSIGVTRQGHAFAACGRFQCLVTSSPRKPRGR